MTRATLTAQEVAEALGVSTWAVYQTVKAGTCPVEPIRVGRRLVWSRARVAAILGVESVDQLPAMGPTTESTEPVGLE